MKNVYRAQISLILDYLNILKGKRTSYWHSLKGLGLCFSPDGALLESVGFLFGLVKV